MQKNGMIQEGELRSHVRRGEQYCDGIQYRLTVPEFEQLHGQMPRS